MFDIKLRHISTVFFVIGNALFCTIVVSIFLLVEKFAFHRGVSAQYSEITFMIHWVILFFMGLPLIIYYSKHERFQEQLVYLDETTEGYNRRYILEELHREINRAKRYGRELSVLMIDIDNFKNVNDTYGHLAGDRILKGVGSILAKSLRSGDIVGRYGGDEFLVILPETGHASAQDVALRLWINVVEHVFRVHKKNVHVSISSGSSSLGDFEDHADLIQFIDRADHAMLHAKFPERHNALAG